MQGEVDKAADDLQSIINDNPVYAAYDALAENCRLKGDAEAEQAVLEAAVNIFPMAILRQQSL